MNHLAKISSVNWLCMFSIKLKANFLWMFLLKCL